MLTGQPVLSDKVYYFGIDCNGIATELWEVEAFCNNTAVGSRGNQAHRRAKVQWLSVDPCANLANHPFLNVFNYSTQTDPGAPMLWADSTGVGGSAGTPNQFTQLMVDIQGTHPQVIAPLGGVTFGFLEMHESGDPATRLQGAWEGVDQTGQPTDSFWVNGAWQPGPMQWIELGSGAVEGGGSDVFSTRWSWDETLGRVANTGLPAFAPDQGNDFLTAFFGTEDQVRVRVHARLQFGNGQDEDQLFERVTVPFHVSLVNPDPGIESLTMETVSGTAQGETPHLHTRADSIPDLRFTVQTQSTAASTINLAVYAETPGGSLSLLRCGSLVDLAADGTFSALTIPDADGGNLAYVMDSLQGDGFHGLIDAPGEYLVRVHSDSCDAAGLPLAHQVRISVNPARSFVIRLHYRDHLGSTTHVKTYAPSFAEGVPGQTIALDLSEGRLTLYPQWTEAMYYEPFGTPIAATDVEGRYTDHEYDQATGFHYMKGRFQDPSIVKFTRPDPLRDYQWLFPQTINLYEYSRNNPINFSDPTGLESVGEMWFEDAVELQTEGKTVRAHLLIGTAILWEAFGAESLSKVADRFNRGKSEELSTGDYFGAGLDTGIGKGVKGLGKLGKSIGGFFSRGSWGQVNL